MFIIKIKLPKKQDADVFVTFMQEEYFPAIRKDATRIGKVTHLLLLQGDTTDTVNEFFLQADGVMSSPRVDDKNVVRKFESFGAKVKALDVFDAVAEWPKPKRSK